MKRNPVLVMLASLILATLVFGCNGVMTQDNAKEIAFKKLSWYCQQEHLKTSDFGEPTATKEKDDFSFDYSTHTQPVHSVRIYVTPTGGVELHRLVE